MPKPHKIGSRSRQQRKKEAKQLARQWLVSGIVGWCCTWGLGRTAVAYFEAGGDAVVDRGWSRARRSAIQVYRAVVDRWRARPWIRVEIGRSNRQPAITDTADCDGQQALEAHS